MRISKIQEDGNGATSTLEIDTEATWGQDYFARDMTHQEYQIIRDLLGIPERQESRTSILIPHATFQDMDGGKISFTASMSSQEARDLYGADGGGGLSEETRASMEKELDRQLGEEDRSS